jgi:hypothetical protein
MKIGVCAGYRQVFGLTGFEAFLLTVASQLFKSQCINHGGRSCLPLRDSSGFQPDSLSITHGAYHATIRAFNTHD